MKTKEEIIEEFKERFYKGAKVGSFEYRKYVNEKDFILKALSQQKQEIEGFISLHKLLKLNCKDDDKIEKKEAHDIVIEAFKQLKQKLTK